MLCVASQAYTYLLSREQMVPAGARVHTVSGAEFWPENAITTQWSLVGTRRNGANPFVRASVATVSGSVDGSHRRLRSAEELLSAGYVRSGVARAEPPEDHHEKMRRNAKVAHKEEEVDCTDLSLPDECDNPACVIALSARAKECPALLSAIGAWLASKCDGENGAGCGYMLNVLDMVGTREAQVSTARACDARGDAKLASCITHSQSCSPFVFPVSSCSVYWHVTSRQRIWSSSHALAASRLA